VAALTSPEEQIPYHSPQLEWRRILFEVQPGARAKCKVAAVDTCDNAGLAGRRAAASEPEAVGRPVERFLRYRSPGGRIEMNLVVWLPAMFLLGLVTMVLCYAFIGACEKI
jgi:hypothetical protein